VDLDVVLLHCASPTPSPRLPTFFLAKAPSPYRATTTTLAYNGWDGFTIIPRWAQAVDYNVPDATVMLKYYK
jgi:hypothetical protein